MSTNRHFKPLAARSPFAVFARRLAKPSDTATLRRVRKAHIFVAALAFLLERMLEHALQKAGIDLSAQSALGALKTIRHVQFRIDGKFRSGTAPGSSRARQILKALKLSDHHLPTSPPGDETTM